MVLSQHEAQFPKELSLNSEALLWIAGSELPKPRFDWLEKVYDQIISEEFNKAEEDAFFAYKYLVPPDLIAENEKNAHHGIKHLVRVMIHAQQSRVRSAEFSQVQESQDDQTLLFAKATELTIRFHDLIQQYLGRLGFGEEAKTLHSEMGALYLMLFSPELQQMGYSTQDIYFAAVMTYYHSEPEKKVWILGSKALSFSKLKTWLTDQLEKKLEAGHLNKKLGRNELKSILDFIPVPDNPNITRDVLQERLDNDQFFIAPDIEEKLQKQLQFFSDRVAIADKMDSSIPADKANWRMEETFSNRPLFVQMDEKTSKSIFTRVLDNLDQKLNLNPGDQELIAQRTQLLALQQEVNSAFQSSLQLPVELDYRLRLLAGTGVAEDGLTRVLYEVTRGSKLNMTQFERMKMAQGLKERLTHYLKILKHCAGVYYDQEIQQVLTEKRIHKQVGQTNLDCIQQLMSLAQAQVSQEYKDIDGSANILPLGGKPYNPEQPSIQAAEIMYRTRREKRECERKRYVQ